MKQTNDRCRPKPTTPPFLGLFARGAETDSVQQHVYPFFAHQHVGKVRVEALFSATVGRGSHQESSLLSVQ